MELLLAAGMLGSCSGEKNDVSGKEGVEPLAVILDLHPDSCFFHAFTYPEWRYVASFGKRGEGPEDILSAERVRICSPDSVWVLDSNRRQITRWRISNGNAERVEEISLDDRLIRILDFCKTVEGFLVTDYTGNYRYHVLDQRGKIIQSVGHVPSEKDVDDSDKPALSQAWRSFMDYNPKNGVLAMVTQLGEVVELFNLRPESTRSITVREVSQCSPSLLVKLCQKLKALMMWWFQIHVYMLFLMVHHSKTVLIRCVQAGNFQQEAIIFMYLALMAVH